MTPNDIADFPVLRDLLRKTCETHKDSKALICQGSTLTYGEVRQYTLKMANYLQHQCGIRKGDRVALFLPNTMQFIISCLATLEIGGVIVNINPLYTGRELEYILKDSEPKVIIFLENFHATLAQIPEEILPQYLICTGVGDCYAWWKKTAIWIYLHILTAGVPRMPRSLARRICWWPSCFAHSRVALQDIPLTIDDLAFLQYTGGTTGTPKGAMLSQGNLSANILQAASWITQFYPHPENFRIATALPLYHIFSLTANFLTFFVLGAENLLIINPRDFPKFFNDWKHYPIDAICGVNTLFSALLKQEGFHQIDKSRLKLVLGGGMAVSPVLAQQWQERTSTTIIQAYGLTEASPAVTMNPLDLHHFHQSIGLPLSHTHVKFIKEDGTKASTGDIGELWVQGPQVMQGYWNHPKETSLILTTDGWLKTGDIGYQDENHRIYLVDRKKDLIIISGFNVYPSEIENLLLKHPDIEEAAVIGELDHEDNEHIVACYVLKQGHAPLSELSLKAYCQDILTAYKVPKKYIQLSVLPKSPIGKILKRALKQHLKDTTERF